MFQLAQAHPPRLFQDRHSQWKATATLIGYLFLGLFTTRGDDGVILRDHFDYFPSVTDLNGVSPTDGQGVGSGKWKVIYNDGSDGKSTINTGNGRLEISTDGDGMPKDNSHGGGVEARYQVSLEPNTIYTLSVTLRFKAAASNDCWIGFGFEDDKNHFVVWSLLRPKFAPGTAGSENSFVQDTPMPAAQATIGGGIPLAAYDQPIVGKIVFNTATRIANFYINGVQTPSKTLILSSNENLNSIFFCSSATGKVAEIESVSLTSSSQQ